MTKHNLTYQICFGVVFFLNLMSHIGFGQDQAKMSFANQVRPIFEKHCYACHGPAAQESEYRLDVKSAAMGVGDRGDQPIEVGDRKHSPLFMFISGATDDERMPPVGSGESLNPEEIEIVGRWIDEGANWPDKFANESAIELGRQQIKTDHWSFQPVVDHVPPDVEWPLPVNFPIRGAVDQFISRSLQESRLRPSLPADRRTLIRRVYLNMLGLYPTSEQVEKFLTDKSEIAYSNLIERVLASPHYGERWARHWLDVVRFGESTGYEVNRDRANAYYYRDYVIDSLNNDKSYQDFILEQLAGDSVGSDVGTGFLVGGAYDIVKSPDKNLTLMQREDELADYVNTTSTTFLGLTVGCARCHNHKFDPILQSDYYSLQAVFAGVQHGERKLKEHLDPSVQVTMDKLEAERISCQQKIAELENRLSPPTAKSVDLPAVNAKQNVDSFPPTEAKYIRFKIFRTNGAEPCIDELEVFSHQDQKNVALASNGCKVRSSGDYQNNPKHKLKHLNDGKYGNNFSWISNQKGAGWVEIELPVPTTIDQVVWGRERNGAYADRLALGYIIEVSVDGKNYQRVSGSSRRPSSVAGPVLLDLDTISRLSQADAAKAKKLLVLLNQTEAQLVKLTQSIPTAYVGKFSKPPVIKRLYRGDPLSPREEVYPDGLAVLGTLGMTSDEPEHSRRLKLAKWIASEDNPLTARVIVNRVWHYHFGRGLVATPSDLGKNGSAPSHPELLDWLAIRFIENDWSLKWLHREILSSSTFQQSSHPRAEALAKDADCKLLWRFPLKRLEAEAIRDCVLQLTGKLNLKAGGPGFLLFKIDRENVHHYFPLESFGPEHFRRMIYMTKIRQEQDEVFGVFDCPDGGQTIPNRNQSTTALQSLNMLNSKFMVEQAEFLSQRLQREAGSQANDQINHAFDLAFARTPTTGELEDAKALIQEFGLASFCRAILNSNEFLFVR
jgi:mono/diheme cytochrome c family protein